MDSDGDFFFFLKNQCIYCYVVRKKDQNFLFLDSFWEELTDNSVCVRLRTLETDRLVSIDGKYLQKMNGFFLGVPSIALVELKVSLITSYKFTLFILVLRFIKYSKSMILF